MNTGFARVALVMVALCSLTPKAAQATVFNPASNPIHNATWTVTPSFTNSWYSDDANTDIAGGQSAANVESVLESAAWLGQPLTFVNGGNCASDPNCTTGPNKSGAWTSNIAATVIGVHFDNQFLAYYFAGGITSFTISNLPNGVSNILAYNLTATPLPGALWLFASALAGWLGFSRWSRKGGALEPC